MDVDGAAAEGHKTIKIIVGAADRLCGA